MNTSVWSVVYPRLPSIEDCKEFLSVVNKGRQAADLEPLEFLDYDGADPNSTNNCLSARNLFAETGYTVGKSHIIPGSVVFVEDANRDVAVAIGSAEIQADGYASLPESILVVTRAFDRKTPGLKERLQEAGVVA